MGIFTRKSKSANAGYRDGPTRAEQRHTERPHDGPHAARTLEVGRALLAAARGHKAGLLSSRFYTDKLMDWSMKDHAFKVQLFRFVDAFPALTTPEMIHEHLVDYLTQPGVKPPPGMDLGLRAGGLAKGLMAGTISKQIKAMAGNFIAGTDAADALPRLRSLWKDGIAFSVDLLGEACVSDDEADAYMRKYLDLVENLVGEASGWPGNDKLERDHLGSIPRVNVSVKLSSLSPRCDPIDPERALDDLMKRLRPVLEAANRNGVFINFDMEQFALKDLTLDCVFRAFEEVEFTGGLAMQVYLKSGVDDARRVVEWAKSAGKQITVRLVKGAYWDYETIHAEEMGWPCPVWGAKWQTDRCFEQMTDVLLDAMPRDEGEPGVKLALGSHNVRSIAHAVAGLEHRSLPREAIELQMLHGMADQLKHAAAEQGLRVREYVPVGEMIPGMAYLVRRLLENTSNESWLKAGFLDGLADDVLLRAPMPPSQQVVAAAEANGRAFVADPPDLVEIAARRHGLSPAVVDVGDSEPFFNEPLRDMSSVGQREAFAHAASHAEMAPVPNDIAPAQASEAVGRARDVFAALRGAGAHTRANVLIAAAMAMRVARDTLSHEIVAEASKPWREADGDVCEAIDFCEYYARQSVGLFERRRLGRFMGELDELWYQPRGVAVVVSPWNFPLAIACGMTVAALVTGNPVILKPAEQTPRIAVRLIDILRTALDKAGLPKDAAQLVAGPGETIGAQLVRDPRVAVVAFTGSKAVGLDIIRAAAETPDSREAHEAAGVDTTHYPDDAYPQRHVKRVVAEMGGKNALIVDVSADLDEAVLGIRYSAFGYAGQKCSANSRLVVVDPEGPNGSITTLLLERLAGATRALQVGSAAEPGCDVPPVIDAEAAKKIRGCIERARSEGLTELVGERDFAAQLDRADASIRDRLIPPHIFTGVTPTHALAREEVFGPVLAVMHAADFDEALAIANDHAYKLTGGVYTRKPAHIERAKAELRVGNLYINRGITGALVARQPFGGFGLSGVGSKAGGPDYLLQFVEPRASTENTMRRGFSPEL